MVRLANNGRDAALRSLAATNAGLEKTVAERTAHLQEANEEVRRTVAVLNNIINSMGDAVVVTDHDNKPAFDEAWATWMPAGHGPVRSFVQSVMPEGDLIEIIITAALPA